MLTIKLPFPMQTENGDWIDTLTVDTTNHLGGLCVPGVKLLLDPNDPLTNKQHNRIHEAANNAAIGVWFAEMLQRGISFAPVPDDINHKPATVEKRR